MDTINEKLNWSDSTSILYTVSSHWSMNTGWIDEVSGYWYNYESIYIGVRFTADNRQLYGWIDMSGNVLRQYAVTEPYLE
ncbi:MAG: hypothetical protein IPH88_02060 [Bacteroidales bacterium]|nr:hypothetical protein [Bacteroidales bacterium]